MLNCLWGHVLKRSPGINRKSRVSYPSPGFLSSATWPSLPKKHYNGLIILIIWWYYNTLTLFRVQMSASLLHVCTEASVKTWSMTTSVNVLKASRARTVRFGRMSAPGHVETQDRVAMTTDPTKPSVSAKMATSVSLALHTKKGASLSTLAVAIPIYVYAI